MPETTAHSSSAHVDDATLAAYVDGRLKRGQREPVEAHLAACEDCYIVFAEVLRTQGEMAVGAGIADAASVARGARPAAWSGRRRTAFAASGAVLAIAASLLLIVVNRQTPLESLVSVVGSERLTAARPTGGFRFGPLRTSTRSSAQVRHHNLQLVAEEARLHQKASETNAPADLHAWAVAQMLSGATRDSVRTLESITARAPGVAAYQADLGAAYLTLFLEHRRPEDGAAALSALDRALALDPRLQEAAFNRALALEHLGRPRDAVAAWDRYLELDPHSEWSADARRHRATSQ